MSPGSASTTLIILFHGCNYSPDSNVHGADMRPTWVLSAPDGPHVGPMNHAIWVTRFSTKGRNIRARPLQFYGPTLDSSISKYQMWPVWMVQLGACAPTCGGVDDDQKTFRGICVDVLSDIQLLTSLDCTDRDTVSSTLDHPALIPERNMPRSWYGKVHGLLLMWWSSMDAHAAHG